MPQGLIYLNIGGLSISVNIKSFYKKELFKIPYNYFVSSRKERNDLDITTEIDSAPRFKTEEIIFKIKPSWCIFRSGKGYVYKDILADNTDSSYLRYAVIKNNFRNAIVYCKSTLAEKIGLLNWILSAPLGQFLITNILADMEGLFLHSCAVKYKNKGFLFVGPSGSGKSTLAGLWRGVKDAVVLSDERVILRRIKQRFWIYGTPWTGSGFAFANARTPLNSIYLIRPSRENFIKKADQKKVAATFFTNMRLPLWDKDKAIRVFAVADTVLSSIPIFELGFTPTKKIIDLILA